MDLPKFVLGDNTDYPDDIFIIHLDYPRFIINLKDDEVEFMEEDEDLDEAELNFTIVCPNTCHTFDWIPLS